MSRWLAGILVALSLAPGSAAAAARPFSAEPARPVVDGHTHEGLMAREGKVHTAGLEGLRARGIDAAVVALPVDRSPTPDLEARVREEVGQLREACLRESGFSVAGGPARPGDGGPDGGIRLFLAIEWRGSVFGGDPTRVRRYRDLGVRMIGPWDKDDDGLFEKDDRSAVLSPLGKRIVAEMNEAGVLIDITHLTHAQKLEVIARSKVPVVASHSLVRSVSPQGFNLPDEVVTALAARGGSVWASFNRSDLLGDGPDAAAVDRLVEQIDVLVRRLGADHVGIGTDLQRGGQYVPAPLNQGDSFAVIRRRLQERGLSRGVIDGVLGRNVLRAMGSTPNASGP